MFKSKPGRLSFVVLLGFLILAGNLFRMQVVKGKYYLSLSEKNRVRAIFLEGARGEVRDRNGLILIKNRLSFNCSVVYRDARKNFSRTAKVLAGILNEDPEELEKTFKKAKPGIFKTILLAEDISLLQAVQIEERMADLPGVMIETRPRREYPLKEAAAHLTGYIGPITRDEYDELEAYGYRLQDWLGREGVEKSYESYLRGRSGGLQLEVDSRGKPVRTLGLQEPGDGKALTLSVDARLQEYVQGLFGAQRGAVAVMNIGEGSLLSINSAPSFDPNLFSSERGRKNVGNYLVDEKAPMVNRALRGQYPAGSIFKIVTALAALDKRKIHFDTSFTCQGFLNLGGLRFDCWKEIGHGPQTMAEAFAHSCNVYFYQTGILAGPEAIAEKAALLGMGRRSEIDLPSEKKGFLPSREWKKRTRKEPWFDGDTANFAIGQGSLQVTPIQALVMAAAAGTKGEVIQPHVITSIDGHDAAEKRFRKTVIPVEYWDDVRKGLDAVVNSDTGTGRLSRVEGLQIAGKTGTAQSGQDKTHAWFVGYSPIENPKIAMVVFLENGGRGGVNAATLASDVFRWLKSNAYL